MKQGLLLKDSPEGRFELYCHYSYGKGTCNILFDTLGDFNKHLKEFHNYEFLLIRELPTRPKRRFHTNQKELDNIKKKKCWCGKSKDQWKKNKYKNYECWSHCCKQHYKNWWTRSDNTAFHRDRFLKQVPRICQQCGVKTNYREMDHIIAIVLGGHPWHYENLQALCSDCHKLKTASDIRILAYWKRISKLDPMYIPNKDINKNETLTKFFIAQ